MSSTWDALRPQFDRVRRAWRGSVLPGFLNWWSGELIGLLPARWRTLLNTGPAWCLLQHEGDQWSVRRDGDVYPLAQWNDALEPATQRSMLQQAIAGIDRQDLRLALCLPGSAALRRRLVLPTAARSNLRRVVAYEIDRQTPFRAEQVYFDVLEPPAAAIDEDRFTALLVAVPRAAMETQLGQLKEATIGIDAVDLLSEQRRFGINLLPAALRQPRHDPRRRANLILAGAIGLLLMACLAQWLHNRRVALDSMQTQVNSMRTEALQVAALRKQLEDNAGAAGFLGRRKAEAVPVIAVLQELTSRLPDDTWLERLTISDGQLNFYGLSPQATQLTEHFKGAHYIGEVSFQGPIQKDPASGKDRFYMGATLRGGAPNPSKASP